MKREFVHGCNPSRRLDTRLGLRHMPFALDGVCKKIEHRRDPTPSARPAKPANSIEKRRQVHLRFFNDLFGNSVHIFCHMAFASETESIAHGNATHEPSSLRLFSIFTFFLDLPPASEDWLDFFLDKHNIFNSIGHEIELYLAFPRPVPLDGLLASQDAFVKPVLFQMRHL